MDRCDLVLRGRGEGGRMMDVLQFIFQDFWHFIGTVILLLAVCPWNNVRIKFGEKEKKNG